MIKEHKFIKLLLGHDFYEKFKTKLVKEMFPNASAYIFDAIRAGHEQYKRDLTISDLRILIKTRNPAMTQAVRSNIEEIFIDIDEDREPLGDDIAAEVVHHMFRQEVARWIADYGIALMDGKKETLHELAQKIAAVDDDFMPVEEYEMVSTDMEQVLTDLSQRPSWRFNIPEFAKHVPGASGGDFIILLARPDTGKTSFLASLVAGPDGYAHQGAKVAWFCNEERGNRVMARCMEAAVGYHRDDLVDNPALLESVLPEWRKIRSNIIMIEKEEAMSINAVDAYAKRNKPDIIIVDQLDKLNVSGVYDALHDKMRALYVQARNIGKRHDALFVGVCQASAEAEGKTRVTYHMAENSKTGKGAEGDLIIGIGKAPLPEGSMEDDNNIRFLHPSKNKLTGWKGVVGVRFDPRTARYIP